MHTDPASHPFLPDRIRSCAARPTVRRTGPHRSTDPEPGDPTGVGRSGRREVGASAGVIAAACAAAVEALRDRLAARLRESALRELGRAVADVLDDPALCWEVVAPGHRDTDPTDGLELDGRGRLECLVPDVGRRDPGLRPGYRVVTSDEIDLAPGRRAALDAWLDRETAARNEQETRAGRPWPRP
ncbi:hypothetical protein JL107_12935 [Nakamurella flavida]|uniref:Uncharacterized protein n=1 Tax=Nakamurella flavida TaxID=363630 RepID=A0A938YGN9_9ACTN|nr:hypothetical protein [Nakamurella flavida]MBM9477351.1 hypothetical protein [Nakamurella flavida]MDP9777283.1 hypothetical protein [Nakamurella flavida]